MAVISRKVFIAPSVFVAFIDRAHPKHEQASAFFRYFAQEEYQLYTDLPSILRAYTTIYKDISPSLGKDFLRTMSLTNINIIYPDDTEYKAALKALINFQSTELSFPDALMAALAVKRGISQICTFDYLHALFGLTVYYLPI
jgi:predicted nucleic acid-binding protein